MIVTGIETSTVVIETVTMTRAAETETEATREDSKNRAIPRGLPSRLSQQNPGETADPDPGPTDAGAAHGNIESKKEADHT